MTPRWTHWIVFLWMGLSRAAGAHPLTAAEIDRMIEAHWRETPVKPAPAAAVPALLRRLSLDLTGRLPPAELVESVAREPKAFDPEAFVRKELAGPAFREHWGRLIRAWITPVTSFLQPTVNRSLACLITSYLAHERGMDDLFRELLTARGSYLDNPAVSYLLQFRDSPENLAGHVAKTFLGAQIQCAQCHDHPFEKWKQADFKGFMAFFSDVRVVQWPRPLLERLLKEGRVSAEQYMSYMPAYVRSGFKSGSPQAEKTQKTIDAFLDLVKRHPESVKAIASRDIGEMLEKLHVAVAARHELTPGTVAVMLDLSPAPPPPVAPRFLDGTAPKAPAGEPQRETLARWALSTSNRLFARSFVNRVFKQVMGRGLTEPVDNMFHPDDGRFTDVRDALAEAFVAESYRLEPLIGRIVRTAAYRRASAAEAPGDGREFVFQHALSRALPPETLASALSRVARTDSADRVAALIDTLAANLTASPGPVSVQLALTLQDALFLINGPSVAAVVREAAAAPEAAPRPGREREWVQRLFPVVFGRMGQESEMAPLVAHLSKATPQAAEDVLWSMVTSVPFLINF